MDIPEDIRATADNCIPVGLLGNHYCSTLRQYIASAILAERERAAGMCDGISKLLLSKNSESSSGALLEALAAAIRTPPTGEEQ